jgi:hypothetical protein
MKEPSKKSAKRFCAIAQQRAVAVVDNGTGFRTAPWLWWIQVASQMTMNLLRPLRDDAAYRRMVGIIFVQIMFAYFHMAAVWMICQALLTGRGE